MLINPLPPRIHVPKGLQGTIRSAVLHTIALAHYVCIPKTGVTQHHTPNCSQ